MPWGPGFTHVGVGAAACLRLEQDPWGSICLPRSPLAVKAVLVFFPEPPGSGAMPFACAFPEIWRVGAQRPGGR